MQLLQPPAFVGAGCKWLRLPIDLSPSASRIPLKPKIQVRWATHGAQGIANGPKNGPGKRLGAKKTGDEYVVTGNIIFRQRGTKWFPGDNVGMGRDHTLFALEAGFVKYYRDPFKHPKRQYIGVVFDRTQKLPAPLNAARRRRLGMVTVPRVEPTSQLIPGLDMGLSRDIPEGPGDLMVGQAPVGGMPGLTKRQAKAEKKRQKSGMLPLSQLGIRPDYSYRESNWSIGRAAERAGVKVKLYKKGDRFLAWRKKTARLARNAEKRAMIGKKGKKDQAGKAGRRTAPVRK